jgi:carboxylate-amine ligase
MKAWWILAADADELGCVRELEYALGIPGRGTSAHRQLQVYHAALDEGLQPAEALCRVVDALVVETAKDTAIA